MVKDGLILKPLLKEGVGLITFYITCIMMYIIYTALYCTVLHTKAVQQQLGKQYWANTFSAIAHEV